jgi:hypothetical protein
MLLAILLHSGALNTIWSSQVSTLSGAPMSLHALALPSPNTLLRSQVQTLTGASHTICRSLALPGAPQRSSVATNLLNLQELWPLLSYPLVFGEAFY